MSRVDRPLDVELGDKGSQFVAAPDQRPEPETLKGFDGVAITFVITSRPLPVSLECGDRVAAVEQLTALYAIEPGADAIASAWNRGSGEETPMRL
jgi:hypothetical protein